MKKVKVYLASGWFTPNTKEILDVLEKKLTDREDVDVYSPRRDGVMLTPNQRHDTALRERVFKDNISHITDADLVLANIDAHDDYNDPGTVYEVGYAMAHNIPVVGFTKGYNEALFERFRCVLDGFECVLPNYEEVDKYFDHLQIEDHPQQDKVLFVGNGNDEVDNKIAAHIVNSGANIRWLTENHERVYAQVDDIFKDVKYMIVVVDDRKAIASWMIGQAYSRGIPVITYSDFNYGINLMLIISILTHIRGTDELKEFLQQVKRGGLDSIPKFDISQMNAI